MKKRLTEKQKRFIEEYCKDFNATQAALRAGYSAKTANRIASENLSKLDIKKAIDKRIEERKKKLEITEKEIIAELARIGFSDMTNYYETNFDLKDLTTLPKEITGAIREIVKIETDKRTRIALKLHSKVQALELLGKHLGMWKADQKDNEYLIRVFDETIEDRTKDTKSR